MAFFTDRKHCKILWGAKQQSVPSHQFVFEIKLVKRDYENKAKKVTTTPKSEDARTPICMYLSFEQLEPELAPSLNNICQINEKHFMDYKAR